MGIICDSCFKEVKSTKISDVSSITTQSNTVAKFEPISDETSFPIVELGQSESSENEKHDPHVEISNKIVVGKKRKLSKQGVKVRLKVNLMIQLQWSLQTRECKLFRK